MICQNQACWLVYLSSICLPCLGDSAVPILVGIDPAIALFSSGLGTLAHLTVTKYKILLIWV